MEREYASNYTDITPITSLWKEWTFLDPGFRIAVELEGKIYPTLTHALNASKTSNLEEREELIGKHNFQVSNWGSVRPFADDPYRQEWEEEVKDITLILTAQRFGLVTLDDPAAKLDDALRYKHAFWLTLTRGKTIIYENLHCDTYWGICHCSRHYSGDPKKIPTGENELGRAIMNVRQKLVRDLRVRSFLSGTCDWCYENKRQLITPATDYIVYFRSNKLTVRSYCNKHRKAENHDARRWGDGQYFNYSISDLPPEVAIAPFHAQGNMLTSRRPFRSPTILLPPSRQRASQMGFSPWEARTTSRSSWSDPKDVFGVMIIHADGSVSNHVTEAV